MGVDKVPSLFAIKNRNLTNEKRNGNDATCVCVPYSFQNYGSICCFGFPLNKIDEEMGEVEPTAQHNHPKTKLRRGINYNSMFSNYKLFCGNPDGQEPGLN